MPEKVVIITGSSRGIGKATALEFLRSGADVVINGRNIESLRKTEEEFRQEGFIPLAFNGDLKDPAVCREMISRCTERYGRLDVLINNAGGGFRGWLEETSPEVFSEVIYSNLMSAVNCTLAALPWIKQSKGSIVFISSLSGMRGMPMNGPYSVAKMGLTALSQALRTELHGTGIHIGIVMVGFTDFDEDKRVTDSHGEPIPIKRKSHQTRDQVAHVIYRTVKDRKKQVVLTPLGKSLAFLLRVYPGMVEKILLRGMRSGYNQ